MVTGDVLLHPQLINEAQQAAQKKGKKQEHDFLPLLAGLQPYAEDADLALCNLEIPVGDAPFSGYPVFKAPKQVVKDLAEIGYDGCTTATNHTVDAGTDGVLDTLDALDDNELFHAGSYRSKKASDAPHIVESHGIKLGVVTTAYDLNGFTADKPWRVDTGLDAAKLIQRAKATKTAGADLVVAAIHARDEYSNVQNAEQTQLAHALAESKAFDFIYMHHTHSLLPIEKYKGTWIVYGLGNSVAKHQTPTILNREGISVKATFTEGKKDKWKVSKLQWVPHLLSTSPVRWCQVADADTSCVSKAEAKDSFDRSEATVDSLGAIDDGLELWELPETK